MLPRLKKTLEVMSDGLHSLVASVTSDEPRTPAGAPLPAPSPVTMTPGLSGGEEGGVGVALGDENEARDYVFRIHMASKPDVIRESLSL